MMRINTLYVKFEESLLFSLNNFFFIIAAHKTTKADLWIKKCHLHGTVDLSSSLVFIYNPLIPRSNLYLSLPSIIPFL